MQGLAFAEGKPLIGVSALDALAECGFRSRGADDGDLGAPAPVWAQVATWVDAWRGDVYAATYAVDQPAPEPVVGRPVDLLEAMGQTETLFIGDGAATFRDLILETRHGLARIADPAVPMLAGTIARRAAAACAAGHRPPPDAIRPLYVRRPDVVLTRQRLADARATDAE
jgi:tRNA A37 threonylcarbamoyladenosine modification protein TsaB